MIMIRAVAIVLLLFAPYYAAAQDLFTSKLALPSGQTAVIAEGDFEPRSIGSFSVRLYEAAEAPDDTTFFIAGLIRARDGAVEKAILADVKGDQEPEIIVVLRSVGTGSYLSAAAFTYSKDALTFEGAVENLAADADPVSALHKNLAKPQ